MTERNRTNNDLQNITQKIKYEAIRITQKQGMDSDAHEG